MDLLDDTLEVGSDLSIENIKEIFKLRQKHDKARKAINNARITLAIVCLFSIFSLVILINAVVDPLVIGITVGFTVILGICAATPPEFAKISLTVAFGIYLLNLIASFFNDPMFALLGLIIKGFFIYFIVIGMIAAFKFTEILKKMERLNITPQNN